ncbi:MAG: hypothetical protein HND44_03395 [Chloroflexi bacterium]|nr:hypothetical protein [Ardenticatenaceae bacterium]NOG33609.1 hypothetical protein [Chloroflexota bacterium]GIK56565.1 MAG: hypothetical protein BroJett015_22280 [Chloroflexota bacterium]
MKQYKKQRTLLFFILVATLAVVVVGVASKGFAKADLSNNLSEVLEECKPDTLVHGHKSTPVPSPLTDNLSVSCEIQGMDIEVEAGAKDTLSHSSAAPDLLNNPEGDEIILPKGIPDIFIGHGFTGFSDSHSTSLIR